MTPAWCSGASVQRAVFQQFEDEARHGFHRAQRLVQSRIRMQQAQGHAVGRAAQRGQVLQRRIGLQMGGVDGQGAVTVVQAPAPVAYRGRTTERADCARAQFIRFLLFARVGGGGVHGAVASNSSLKQRW